ncbi:hypothetical protein DPEC_G00152760 [Dallia pectoralis]|uniref:Uncharacterized protein n=1 Tax=Dallia pectoralis TaxID=75939 RepID=A0ACC2GJR0_DALPE|nr:hypothetical protein DPEC_G00152760 [Dallia pectoralis]
MVVKRAAVPFGWRYGNGRARLDCERACMSTVRPRPPSVLIVSQATPVTRKEGGRLRFQPLIDGLAHGDHVHPLPWSQQAQVGRTAQVQTTEV